MWKAGAIKLEWLVWGSVLGRALSCRATTLMCTCRDSSVRLLTLFNRPLSETLGPTFLHSAHFFPDRSHWLVFLAGPQFHWKTRNSGSKVPQVHEERPHLAAAFLWMLG